MSGATGSALTQGNPPPVDLVATTSGGADPGQDGVRTRDRIGRAQISLKNTGDQPLKVTPDPAWRLLADGTARPARWIPQTGALPESGAFSIAGKSTGTLLAEGDFEAAGTYVIGLKVSATGSGERQFSMTVTRTVAPIPESFFIVPKPARIDLGFFDLTSRSVSVLSLPANNASNDPVPLGTPKLIRFSTVSGDTESPAALPTAPIIDAGTCTGELRSKDDCALKISLPAGLSAGRYAVDVTMSGAGGGRASASMKADVRLSAFWAGLLVAIGALSGYLVMIWRERGRAILDHRIAAAEARVAVTRLIDTVKSSVVRQRAAALGDSVRRVESTIAAGGDPTAALSDLGSRYEFLAKADQILAQAEQSELRSLFEPLTNRLKSELKSDQWTVANASREATRLQNELAVLNELVAAANDVKARLNELELAISWLPAEAMKPVSDARRKLAGAFSPIPESATSSEGSELKTRADGIRAAAADLPKILPATLSALLKQIDSALTSNPANKTDLEKLRAELTTALERPEDIDAARAKPFLEQAQPLGLTPPPRMRVETAGAEDLKIPQVLSSESALTLDFNPFLLGIGQAVLPGKLRAMRIAWTTITNLIVLLSIGLSGILVLWASNSSWGSPIDLATAFLAGAGTRLAIGSLPAPR